MKKALFFLLLMAATLVSAQKSMVVTYDYFYNQDISPAPDAHESTLVINPGESLYEIDVLENQDKIPEKTSNKYGAVRVIKEKSNRYVYKNLKDNTYTSKHNIYFKKFIVRNSLDIFDWKLTGEKKEILGYECQKATLHYGGRDYTAYFAPGIPVNNGPWKFHGLPGLILEIRTKDPQLEFFITAKKIELNKDFIAVSNPFQAEKKLYSWDEYTKIYREKYEEITGYQGENGTSLSMSKGKIEIIVEE